MAKDYDQEENLFIQWCLCAATFLAFGAAGYYALVAKQQLVAMNEALKEAHTQNVAQERAVLIIGDSPSRLQLGGLAIHVKNQGRMPATVISYKVRYTQIVSDGPTFEREQEVKPSSVVSIEDPYVISVSLPSIPPYVPRKVWDVSLSVLIKYDDGFGETHVVSSCFNPKLDSYDWQDTCMWINSVDLSKSLATDIVVPEQPKK